MNKSELTSAIAEKTGMSASAVNEVLSAFEATIVGEVKGGGKVQLPGFLSFEQTTRAARTGRNPQTGAEIQIAAATVPKVKVGKSFKDAVGGK
jgi:DNA-binding protein HU-beta